MSNQQAKTGHAGETFVREFESSGDDFSGYVAALEWLKSIGVSYGSMQRDAPIALMLGEFNISKWRNLSESEKASLDGVIEFPDRSPRSGMVRVTLYSAGAIAKAKEGGAA